MAVIFQMHAKMCVCVIGILRSECGGTREGKWKGNWRMEWVDSTLTWPRNVVYPALLTLMRTPRLPAVDWTDSPADLNGLVRLGERRNLDSVRVPSVSARALPIALPVGDLVTATYWVQHTTSCSVQSNAPEDGQNCWPKHVELIWIYQ